MTFKNALMLRSETLGSLIYAGVSCLDTIVFNELYLWLNVVISTSHQCDVMRLSLSESGDIRPSENITFRIM